MLHFHPVGEGEVGALGIEVELEDAAGEAGLVTRPFGADHFEIAFFLFGAVEDELGAPHLAPVDFSSLGRWANPLPFVIAGGAEGEGEELFDKIIGVVDEDPLLFKEGIALG